MKRDTSLFVMLALTVMLLIGGIACAEGGVASLAQLNAPGMTVGVGQGSAAELTVRAELPEASVAYFPDHQTGYLSVAQGKVDAFVYDYNQMRIAIDSGLEGVCLLDETLGEPVRIAVGISPVSKIPELEDKLNRFIGELRADGTLDDMFLRWVINGEDAIPEISVPESPSFTLVVGTSGIAPPYSYFVGTELAGYDIELANRFAAWLGADLEFKVYDYGAIIPAAVTGDVDCIMADLNITPERAEALPFSDVLFEEKLGVMVAGEGVATAASGVDGVHWQDYNGKTLGILTGTNMEAATLENFPDSDYLYLNGYPDCNAALLAGKIDGYLGDEPGLKSVHAEQPQIDYIHEYLTYNEYNFAFRKNDPDSDALREELNAWLAESWENGTMDEIDAIWFGVDEDRKVVDMSDLTGENGTIRVVTTSTDMPFSYIKDGRNVGYDIDVVVRFCRDRGYALELIDVDFAARIPALQSGKADFTTSMNVTPEREEEVNFSNLVSSGGMVLAVRAEDLERAEATAAQNTTEVEDSSFIGGIKSSFNKTFLREDRWKLFTQGVLTTLLITLLTILFGTLLGFGLFMLCRNGNPVANLVTRFCLWLVQGMPMVVLLMILYYIVFGSVAINGVAVAVIGFTLTFSAAVYGLLKMGVGAVDNGQYEAACALGYSNRQTFFKIILPQALPHVLPAYRGEIVGLIKATAIVGYIAVQDLTKMGDIVRSRTYEAFFPLIAVTVIYFVLEGLIGFLVSRISVGFDPKRRRPADILKGVKTDDQN